MFRTGRRGAERLLGLVVFALAGCAEAPPPEFVSKADKFRVRFGATPQIRERMVADRRAVSYTVEEAPGARSVSVMELPIKGDEAPGFSSWALNSAKDDLIRSADGKELTSTSITLVGKYPGREFTARLADPVGGLMRARIWLVDKRLYQVTVIGTEGYANSATATAFLDSFQLTE